MDIGLLDLDPGLRLLPIPPQHNPCSEKRNS